MAEKTVKYVALCDFRDLQDNNRVYKKDEIVPKGKKTKARLDELLGKANALGKPVIKEVE